MVYGKRYSPPPVGLSWDSPTPPPESVWSGRWTYADVTTKISRIDRLPSLLRNGAPLIWTESLFWKLDSHDPGAVYLIKQLIH